MIKRKLFYPERLLSFDGGRMYNHGRDQVSATPITLTISIHSEVPLELELLQNAVCRLQKKHPALRARVLNGYVEYTDEIIHSFPIRVVDRDSDIAWVQIEQEEITAPFDFRHGPLFHIAWIRDAGLQSELVLTIPHAIADGRSMLILFRELIVLLNEQTLEMQPYQPFLNLADFVPGSPLSRRERREAYIWSEMRKWSAISHYLFKKRHINNSNPYNEPARLDDDTGAALRQLADEHNVSVGNICCAVVLKLFQKHLYPHRTDALVFVPIDLRRYFPRIRRDMIFSFASMQRIQIAMTPESDVWACARAFENQLIEKAVIMQKQADDAQSPYSLFKGLKYLEYCSRVVRHLIRKNVSFNEGQYFHFSNFGRISRQGKGPHFGEIIDFQVSLSWINPTYVGVLETANRLSLAFISDESFIPRAKMQEIRDAFQLEIQALLNCKT